MKRTFIATAVFAVVLAISALAQSGSPTPGGAAAPAASTPAVIHSTLRRRSRSALSIFSRQLSAPMKARAISKRLQKKFEPRRTELQNLNTEVENLKKQLNTQGDKMNEEARATLVKSIETKQKSLQRSAEDAQNEFQAPAERDRAANTAEDGARDRQVRQGQRLRFTARFLESVAAGSTSLGYGRCGHNQADC